MGTVKQINIKIRTYYFYNHISDLQNMMQGCYELTKNHTKHWYLEHWIYYN